MLFGPYLRQIRRQCQMSQRSLAQAAGIDFTYISKIEHGAVAPPSAKVIALITDALEQRGRELSLAEDLDAKELYLLADKFPYGLRRMVQGNPGLMELLALLAQERFPDDLYRELVALIEKRRS